VPYKSGEEFARDFNDNYKNAIMDVEKYCDKCGLNSKDEIAKLLISQKKNLNPLKLSDYLGSDGNKQILNQVIKSFDFTNLSFMQSLRLFLRDMELPKESQKIDRLTDAFGERYFGQNSDSNFANADAVSLMAFQAIMLNTDLHNPNVKKKMSFTDLQRNLRGCNNKKDFAVEFLREFYDDIAKNAFTVNITQIPPGMALNASSKETDNTHALLLQCTQGSEENKKANVIFPTLSDEFNLTVTKPKTFLERIFGYQGTINVTQSNHTVSTIQIYEPGWFSSQKPQIIIQPHADLEGHSSTKNLHTAAIIAAAFKTPVSTVAATYDYLKNQISEAYRVEKYASLKNDNTSNSAKAAPITPRVR
jgi:guanine nucleotide exchange protein RalF